MIHLQEMYLPSGKQLLKMAIEIVDLPIKLEMVIFHSYVSLPQGITYHESFITHTFGIIRANPKARKILYTKIIQRFQTWWKLEPYLFFLISSVPAPM
jgi:hypothetical protein